MNISNREEGGVTVVGVEGNLDTNTAPDAQQHLDALQDDEVGKILVNFEQLDYISSAGLRVLLATAKRLGTSGGSLRICGLNETVSEVFEISGFSVILNVFGSEAEALEGF
ncbi:MAG: STAS domain-containing protein [Planctomycetota bacterium]|jgi:anti-sigma B factor antagonist